MIQRIPKQKLKIGLIMAIKTAIFVGFVNCSQSIKFSSLGDGLSKLKSNGNGETYEGKLDGRYYRIAQNFQCEGKIAPVGVLLISGDEAALTINTKEKCNFEQKRIPLEKLASSAFDDHYLGFKEGAYEKYATTPDLTQNGRLLEAWCQQNDIGSDGLDTVIKYDPSTHASDAALISGSYDAVARKWSTQSSTLSSVSRNLVLTSSQKQLSYKAADFELNVDLRNPDQLRPGTFTGKLQTTLNGVHIVKDLHCRIGGGLDGKNFRLQLGGSSSGLTTVGTRVFNETQTQWPVTGTCDVLLGDVKISGSGLNSPITIPCTPAGGGTFVTAINYSVGSPAFTNSFGGKEIRVSQSPAAEAVSLLFKTVSTNPAVFISTVGDLQSIVPSANKVYILLNDIDVAATNGPTNNFTPIGDLSLNGAFTGVFEGNNKTISNIDIVTNGSGVGLFAQASGVDTEIKNLNLDKITINGLSSFTGSLVGQLTSANVTHCSVTDSYIGGTGSMGLLVGISMGGKIASSSAKGTIRAQYTAGGLVGRVFGTEILESSAQADVAGSLNLVGGLIGQYEANAAGNNTLTNSWAGGSVSSGSLIGGLIGKTSGSLAIRNSYNTTDVQALNTGSQFAIGSSVGQTDGALSAQNIFYGSESVCGLCDTSPLGQGLNKTALTQHANFLNWDFTTPVWILDERTGLPILRSND